MTLGNFCLPLARLRPDWEAVSDNEDVSIIPSWACRKELANSASSWFPVGTNPRELDEDVWEEDGSTEMLSNINAGSAQHVCFTYMLWCTGGIVSL